MELRFDFSEFLFRKMETCLERSSVEKRLHFIMRNVGKMLR